MRRTALCLVPILLACAYVPASAEPKPERTVNAVYPGEVLLSALNDLAAQLGYTFQPGVYEDDVALDELIWVHARGVSPRFAADLVGASGGVVVTLDETNRVVGLREPEEWHPATTKVRSYKVAELCKLYTDYLQRYGAKLDDPADAEYTPAPSTELLSAVQEILQLGDAAPGSAVGKRLIFTRSPNALDRIGELVRLMAQPGGGESTELKLDRTYRQKLAAVHTSFGGEGTMVSAMLWQLFKESDVPVYVDREQMMSFDLEFDETTVVLGDETSHYDGLMALGRECDFFVDSKLGALRIHEDYFAGASSYRVFDVAALLAELELEYADLKTDDQLQDGFHGDLRSEGGVHVIVDALMLQLDNAGFTPLIRAYGPRVVVVGGVDIVDRAGEVLEAMGWVASATTDGDKK